MKQISFLILLCTNPLFAQLKPLLHECRIQKDYDCNLLYSKNDTTELQKELKKIDCLGIKGELNIALNKLDSLILKNNKKRRRF